MSTEKYNGWTNWDTWETFNIISNEERSYNTVVWAIKHQTISIAIKDIKQQLKLFYSVHKIPNERQVNIDKINFNEIIAHMNDFETLNHIFK